MSYTIIYIAPSQFSMLTPYVSAVVKLDEGASLPGLIKYVEPERVQVGMRVKVDFEPASGNGWPQWTHYYFKPD